MGVGTCESDGDHFINFKKNECIEYQRPHSFSQDGDPHDYDVFSDMTPRHVRDQSVFFSCMYFGTIWNGNEWVTMMLKLNL